MQRIEEIKSKLIKDGNYLKISIDRDGSLYTPDSKLDYLGSGILTIYEETIEELIEECKLNNVYFRTLYKEYGSPYGNKTCKFN
tara:strand:- start:1084 stop:1335 length:252 start_codon:yes stop_codon:yes gene_type:complete